MIETAHEEDNSENGKGERDYEICERKSGRRQDRVYRRRFQRLGLGLMSDLAAVEDMSGKVLLYDIDREAAERNAVIGNRMKELEECRSSWDYRTADTLGEALKGADFVVISIMPGTFDEMESDVHAPEAYGIYQSVGDTTGPGGLMRALRTIPMFEACS